MVSTSMKIVSVLVSLAWIFTLLFFREKEMQSRGSSFCAGLKKENVPALGDGDSFSFTFMKVNSRFAVR